MSCANSGCKNCNGTCNQSQAFCNIDREAVIDHGFNFDWPEALDADKEIAKIWTADAWNDLKSLIDDIYNEGDECSINSEGHGPNPMSTVSKDDPITADILNQVREALDIISGSVDTVNKDDVIKRDYAAQIKNSINLGMLPGDACDECNVGCDVDCNACIGCVSCQGVQHYSTCYGSCYGSG